MTDREGLKKASKNVIDIMSNLGKQFVEEAIVHGEPILDMLDKLTSELPESKKDNVAEPRNESETNIFNKNQKIKVNDEIQYFGDRDIYSELIESQSGYTLLFKLHGVNRQDLVAEKGDNSIEIFCKTSINESRIPEFKYKDKQIKFTLKTKFSVEFQNITVELKDGLLKLNIEKPVEIDSKADEIITVV